MMSEEDSALSIIVVNWNTRDLLDECLESIYRTVTFPSVDVWVVDNASSDGSVEMVRSKYPLVNLVVNEKNEGFGRANNQAMRFAKAETILFLNSDVELSEGAVDEAWSLLQGAPSIGAMGCALVGMDGEVQESWGLRLPHGPAVRTGLHLPDGLIDCAYVWAAFMLVHRSVLDKVGVFDEDFYMFHEDTDLCWRILKGGWRIAYCPGIRVKHVCRQSVNILPVEARYGWLLKSEAVLLRKHLFRWQRELLVAKRLLHFPAMICFHRLGYALTRGERHADRLLWYRTGLAVLESMR